MKKRILLSTVVFVWRRMKLARSTLSWRSFIKPYVSSNVTEGAPQMDCALDLAVNDVSDCVAAQHSPQCRACIGRHVLLEFGERV
jgi:hypothetical protein